MAGWLVTRGIMTEFYIRRTTALLSMSVKGHSILRGHITEKRIGRDLRREVTRGFTGRNTWVSVSSIPIRCRCAGIEKVLGGIRKLPPRNLLQISDLATR
jgi:hypothetical protein